MNAPDRNTDRLSRIRAVLKERFHPVELELIDDSHRHVGHPGAQGGGHFRVRIRAEEFAALPVIKRHQLIYSALAELMQNEIHALSIDARAPGEGSAGSQDSASADQPH